MAKRKEWTIITAKAYVNRASQKGLTYWSAIDFLKGKGVKVHG